jgi:aryl-alcohol dehydrogenase-like predicted oxidoreductase
VPAQLALGSAQFGLDYGATNPDGQVRPAEVARILAAASAAGVDLIDTAPSYGKAEAVLGSIPASAAFRFVSKTPRFRGQPIGAAEVAALQCSFEASCRALGQHRLHGLLLHNVEDLLAPGGGGLLGVMRELQAAGRVAKIGISVYTEQEIDRAQRFGFVDIVQVPFSLVDQRLLHSGHLAALARAGIELHARSIFLQGLLLLRPEALPRHLARFASQLERLLAECHRAAITPLAAALGFVLAQREIREIIVGVTSVSQFAAIQAAARPLPAGFDWRACAATDAAWLHPGQWPAA